MLVLSRRRDQAIMIGDDVEITVVDIRGDKVRLGIRAAASVPVHRREIYDQIKAENEAASKLNPHDLTGLPSKSVASPPPQPAVKLAQPIGAEFLSAALEEARKSLAEGGLPIGSVLVRNGQIIGRGYNKQVQQKNPLAHAELDCLASAGPQQTYRDTILYCTVAPGHLGLGAAIQLGIAKVIVGDTTNTKFTVKGSLLPSQVEVMDAHDAECIDLLSRFVREHPDAGDLSP